MFRATSIGQTAAWPTVENQENAFNAKFFQH
jgi:hypothetical protein